MEKVLPSSLPPHGDFQQHQPVLDSPGHGLEEDVVEVPGQDLGKVTPLARILNYNLHAT